MEDFKKQTDMYYRTKNNIIENVQESINSASDNGYFHTTYIAHTYELLDSLGIINLLRDNGYDIQNIEHPHDKKHKGTVIFWR